MSDLRLALRQFRLRPAFSLAVILILGTGIAASVTVFSVFYQVLLRPLPYPHADRIVSLHNAFPKNQVSLTGVSPFDYAEIGRRKEVFSIAAAYFFNDMTLTGSGAAVHVDPVNVSASLFDVLQIPARLGRTFSPADDRYGAERVAVLSDAFWRDSFSADPQIVGRSIRLNNLPYTVVGVMPPSFQFPYPATQLWLPLAFRPADFTVLGRSEKYLRMVARLAPGMDEERARAALRDSAHRLTQRFPDLYPGKQGWSFAFTPLAAEQTTSFRTWLYLAFGAVFCVLLIACFNVSGLLLIGATSRSGEFAVRAALGASRARMLRQTLTETGVLVISGCGLGAILAVWAVALLDRYGPLPAGAAMDWVSAAWIGGFVVAIASIGTLAAGLPPALLLARLSIEHALKTGATRTTTAGGLVRYVLVASQIAIALALIFSAGILSRSFLRMTQVAPGFAAEGVWTGSIEGPRASPHFFSTLQERLAALPMVESVSGVNGLPFNPSGVWTGPLRFPGRVSTTPPPQAQFTVALPGYFATMRISLRQGRVFTRDDRPGSPPVSIIDEELARRYFPSEDPIGKFITAGGQPAPTRVVGVVGSVQNSELGGPPEPQIYFPQLQEQSQFLYLVVRTRNDAEITSTVRALIKDLDPNVALYDVSLMSARVASSLALRRFVAWLLTSFALFGMALAAAGLYASLAQLVELRRREIGIRLALGALPRQIAALVVRRAALLTIAGLAGGFVATLAAQRFLKSQIFGVAAYDPVTCALAFGALLAIGLTAAFLPARRAMHTDPIHALREE